MSCGGLARYFLSKNKMASAWSGHAKSQNHARSYRKLGKIRWAKLSRFLRVPQT